MVRSRTTRALLVGVMIVLVSACGRQEIDTSGTAFPTIAPAFSNERPTIQPPQSLPLPTVLPASTAQTQSAPADQTEEFLVYDDELVAGWSLKETTGPGYKEVSTYFFSGSHSIMVEPSAPFQLLNLGVVDGSEQVYPREQVLGVRFRVSGGENYLPEDGLIVSVIGSNDYDYFVPDDTSATRPPGRITSEEPLFPETRLYYLGVNRDIKPQEWAEVIVWLDDHFTPDYK